MSSKNEDNIYKNSVKDYNKDNVFDKFDISELIREDLLIPKVQLENFFYIKEIQKLSENTNNSQKSVISNNSSEDNLQKIISEINNNNFNIHIDELIITFPNDYKVSFIDLYTPIELIGQGGFGIVLSVIDRKNNKKIAAKIISKSSHKEEFYLIEAELLQKLNHKKILKFYNVINTEDYLFIFTDLCEGGTLKDFIISRYNNDNNYLIKDSECSIIIKNILQGIEYLSQNGVIHRDLKPENIMFKDKEDLNSLVICDLGIAGELKNIYSFMDCKCGTLTFMAPEIIMDRQYDKLVDIWSTGIIMYILESGGSHPLLLKSKAKDKYIEDIKLKKKFIFPEYFPSIARNLFLKMCKYEPCFRYDVSRALNHPWITRQNKLVPLTIFDNLKKEEKINNFKEMLMTMVFIRQFKKLFKLSLNETENRSEYDLVRRKLNIRKKNIDYELYPTPYNYLFSIPKRKKSSSIRELPILTRPCSKNDRNNNKNNNNSSRVILNINSFNTAKKQSERYTINSKNSYGTQSKQTINKTCSKIRNLSKNRLNYKQSFKKPKFKISNTLTKNSNNKLPSTIHENNNQQLRTPVLAKKNSFRNIDNNSNHIINRMMKNKENINCLNSINHNNNYSNKNNNNIMPNIPSSKANLIEPKNLFSKPNYNLVLKNIYLDSKKNNF